MRDPVQLCAFGTAAALCAFSACADVAGRCGVQVGEPSTPGRVMALIVGALLFSALVVTVIGKDPKA
jgi:hypothetical protein